MSTLDTPTLEQDLKALIIAECQKEDDFSVSDISDDEPLIGARSRLRLDSLDTLQISMAVLKKYGVRIEGAAEGRIALASINALANYIIKASR
jgi:acyl carrier protein